MLPQSTDWVVLYGTLRLRAVESVVRDVNLAEAVAFGAHG